MKIFHSIIEMLDALCYIAASIGIFVAAFKGSMIWVCVCGFVLIDEGITMLYRKLTKEAGK
jgi:hypothetical protein